jgi:flagellar FliL protein
MSDSNADAAPEKKGRNLLVPLVVVAAVAAGAFFLGGDVVQAALGSETPEASASEETAPAEFGEFAELDGIIINPRGTDGRRYLMVKVGAEAQDPKTLTRLNALGPVAKDAVIDMMASRTVEELSDVTRRDSLKELVRGRFNEILGEDGPVTRVYFTQYVLQ